MVVFGRMEKWEIVVSIFLSRLFSSIPVFYPSKWRLHKIFVEIPRRLRSILRFIRRATRCIRFLFGVSCYFFLFLFILDLLPTEASEKEIKYTVSNFFYYINNQKYEKAYSYFSDAIKQEVPFWKFKEKAKEIKKAKIVKLSIYDQDKHLAKLHIKAKLELIYRGRNFEALYGGICDLQYAQKKWKLISVDMRPIEQREILKEPIHFGK